MDSKRIETGDYLIQVDDHNRVLVIGESLVTVWEKEQDFYDNLDGANNVPLDTFESSEY